MFATLTIENLSVIFSQGTVNEHRALRNLSLHLMPGDFVTIIGSNGAGKSTLFGAICGSVPCEEGRVVLDGEDITYLPEHKRALSIGRLFQDPMKGTAPDLTIAENLALAHARKKKRALSRAITRKDLTDFRLALADFSMGLEDRMNTKVGLLSGGQRQAMTLLMSTISEPKLLLLDEHTAALDPATAENVLRITREIVQRQRLTTLMITHNIQSALTLGNRTIMMDAGRIILDIRDEERKGMTVDRLLSLYARKRGEAFDNDRVLLSMDA